MEAKPGSSYVYTSSEETIALLVMMVVAASKWGGYDALRDQMVRTTLEIPHIPRGRQHASRTLVPP